ncbi:MAG: hypothetical protein U0165_08115 [Polyangiaceae bacterium]
MAVRLIALGHPVHVAHLDLNPFGEPAELIDITRDSVWLHRYKAANDEAFGAGPLALPGWVLVDLYVMPTIVGMLVDGDTILAAYVAVPTLETGTYFGCSLLSRAPGSGLATKIKTLTLKMLRARKQRGLTQITSRSIGVHTRVGPMLLEGMAPSLHEQARESFVYSIDLLSESAWEIAYRGEKIASTHDEELHDRTSSSLSALLKRVSHGERIYIVGLSDDYSHLRVRVTA